MKHSTVAAIAAIVCLSGCVESKSECAGQCAVASNDDKLIWSQLDVLDVGSWSHDDRDETVDPYMSFDGPDYTTADESGVFVDMPCNANDLLIARFVGIARGPWQYRAAIRLFVNADQEHPALSTVDVPGALSLVSQPRSDQEAVPVILQGVVEAPPGGMCHVGVKGKTLDGSIDFFGAASLVVERHISRQ